MTELMAHSPRVNSHVSGHESLHQKEALHSRSKDQRPQTSLCISAIWAIWAIWAIPIASSAHSRPPPSVCISFLFAPLFYFFFSSFRCWKLLTFWQTAWIAILSVIFLIFFLFSSFPCSAISSTSSACSGCSYCSSCCCLCMLRGWLIAVSCIKN